MKIFIFIPLFLFSFQLEMFDINQTHYRPWFSVKAAYLFQNYDKIKYSIFNRRKYFQNSYFYLNGVFIYKNRKIIFKKAYRINNIFYFENTKFKNIEAKICSLNILTNKMVCKRVRIFKNGKLKAIRFRKIIK